MLGNIQSLYAGEYTVPLSWGIGRIIEEQETQPQHLFELLPPHFITETTMPQQYSFVINSYVLKVLKSILKIWQR